MITFSIVMALSSWMITSKLGLQGWENFIPVYSLIADGKIIGWDSGKVILMLILLFIPLVNIIAAIMLLIYWYKLTSKVAEAYSARRGLMFFFAPIYGPYLAFSNVKNADDAVSRYLAKLIFNKDKVGVDSAATNDEFPDF